MKRNLTFLFAFMLSVSVIAQNLTAKVGPEYKTSITSTGFPQYFLKVDDNYAYALRYKESAISLFVTLRFRSYYIAKYDIKNNYSLVWIKSLFNNKGKDASEKINPLDCIGVSEINGSINLFLSNFDKQDDKLSLNALQVDEDGNVQGDGTTLSEVEAEKKSKSGNYDYARSKDKKRILVVYNPHYEKMADEKIVLQLFDENLNEIAQKEIEFEESDSDFEILNYTISNDGEAYMLARIFKGTTKKGRTKTTAYEYKIYSIDLEGDVSSDTRGYVIDLDGKYPNGLIFSVFDNYFICSGYYGDNSNYSVSGAYYLKIDRQDGEVVSNSIVPFSDEDFTGSGLNSKNSIDDLTPSKIIMLEDGSIYLLGESYYTYVSCDSKGNNCVRHFINKDVVVTRISPEGEIKWSVKIPKNQHRTRNNLGISFMSFMMGKDLVIMYNDHEENLKLKSSSEMKEFKGNPKKTVIVYAVVEPNGKLSRKALLKNADYKMLLSPDNAISTENSVYAMLVNNGYTKERIIEIPLKGKKKK